ncbi:hypothetical protein AB4Y96_02505 [Phyllobacterium sp. TAF24]|jgi:hypothetical protein|uniref:hypothetical protein n=1 Tax=unclassified Phyllobacterium TaxID=2638441 RepID=UPI0008822225|nr:hypothetical protein [Phyllobacterium sp. OV277]SDO71544.1 hypothetical protein SAMN05443582_102873 [Phyllobacterium sp. OV277]
MRHGYLQFNAHSRARKLARGAAKRVRASDIVLGMMLVTLVVWLIAYAFIHMVTSV